MRLASTADFNGYTLGIYNFTRDGYALKGKGQAADTVDEIVQGYQTLADGTPRLLNYDESIYNTDGSVKNQSVSYSYLAWSAEQNKYVNETVSVPYSYIDRYLKSRERKLRISEYIFEKNLIDKAEYFYIGIDDSSSKDSIQTIEKVWLENKGAKYGDKFRLFSGIDEIGLMSMAALVTNSYGSVNVKVDYYGSNKNHKNEFGVETLEQTVDVHIEGVGATKLPMGSINPDYLHILVLTPESNTDKFNTAINNLINQAAANIENGIPTCIIDGSEENKKLGNALIQSDVELSKLLGYSNWNTVANATGISISNAVARYSYLMHSDEVTNASNHAFLKQISYSFIKDVAYKANAKKPGSGQPDDTYANRVAYLSQVDQVNGRGQTFYYWRNFIIHRLNGATAAQATTYLDPNIATNAKPDLSDPKQFSAEIMVTPRTADYIAMGQIKFVGDLYWPWNRMFEASFDLAIKGVTNWALNTNNGVVTLPELAADAPATEAERYHATLNDGKYASSFDWNDARFTDWWSTGHYEKVYDEAGASITQVTVDFTDGNGNAVTHGVNFLTANILKREDSSNIALPDAIKVYALDENGNYVYVGEFKYNTELTGKNEWITAGIKFVETTSIRLDIYGWGHIMMNEIQVW